MSLVAYDGSSDESDTEEQESATSSVNGQIVSHENKPSKSTDNLEQDLANSKISSSNESGHLFTNLPSPQKTFSMPENTFKLLSKKQPVKIILPSLNDIKTDDVVKKPKQSQKGSGLFALLPAPKNVTNFMPNSVKKANVSKPPSKPLVPDSLRKPRPKPITKNIKTLIDDDDDDINLDGPGSFFFNAADDVKPEEMEPVIIPEVAPKAEGLSIPPVLPVANGSAHPGPHPFEDNGAIHDESEMSDINEEAIEKLCGVGAKKRKTVADEVIDINVNSMVGDAYMWLSKDLTREQEHSSSKKAKNLSNVERRKHQITYLASQAKEKEMELRNQWANSRMTRKQTQSKYGF